MQIFLKNYPLHQSLMRRHSYAKLGIFDKINSLYMHINVLDYQYKSKSYIKSTEIGIMMYNVSAKKPQTTTCLK